MLWESPVWDRRAWRCILLEKLWGLARERLSIYLLLSLKTVVGVRCCLLLSPHSPVGNRPVPFLQLLFLGCNAMCHLSLSLMGRCKPAGRCWSFKAS